MSDRIRIVTVSPRVTSIRAAPPTGSPLSRRIVAVGVSFSTASSAVVAGSSVSVVAGGSVSVGTGAVGLGRRPVVAGVWVVATGCVAGGEAVSAPQAVSAATAASVARIVSGLTGVLLRT